MTSKPYYKWIVCIGVLVLMFCTIGLTFSAFSIYMPYIRAIKGFTNAQTSLIVTMRTMAGIIAVLFVDKFLQKTGLRLGMLISLIGVGCSFLLYAFSPNYIGYIIAAILCGTMYSLSGVAATSVAINTWFKTGRGTAMGIASAGSGVSSIVAPIVIVPIIENMSLSWAFIIEALFIFVCAVFVFVVVKNAPPGEKPLQIAIPKNKEKKKEPLYMTSKNMTVVLFVSIFLIGVVIFSITGFMSMVFATHFSSTNLAFLSTVYGVALMVSKIMFGKIADKLGTIVANFVIFIPVAIGLIGAPFASNYAVAIIMAIMLGVGSPISAVAIPIYANNISYPDKIAVGLKYFNFVQNIAGFGLSFVMGILADFFGSYTPMYIAAGGIALVTLVLVTIVYISLRKTKKMLA